MRRSRTVREHRNELLKKTARQRQKATVNKAEKKVEKSAPLPVRSIKLKNQKKLAKYLKQKTQKRNKQVRAFVELASREPKKSFNINFSHADNYKYNGRSFTVVHFIESLGLGGAQVMLCELVSGLIKYHDQVNNIVVSFNDNPFDRALYNSYNIQPEIVNSNLLKEFCSTRNVDIFVHHRVANSKCVKQILPEFTKYVLINHTINNLFYIRNFSHCDVYISVCKFLNDLTRWGNIHPHRRAVILNGIENDYVSQLDGESLGVGFHTGRCQRLVGNKFSSDSLNWIRTKVVKQIPEFKHHIIGSNKEAKKLSDGDVVKYYGIISDKFKKMSLIKSFDAYFYETFGDEGASVAILESLACGVPVLCSRYGGCPELVIDKMNGFILKDRKDYLSTLCQLRDNKKILQSLKEQTLKDFSNRLHIRHCVSKYMQIFEVLINVS